MMRNLFETHHQRQALLEASSDAVFTVNRDGLIRLWSRSAERVYGYSSSEIIGYSIARLWPPHLECQHQIEEVLLRLKFGDPLEHFGATHQTKHRQQIHVECSMEEDKLQTSEDGAGEPVYFVSVTCEIAALRETQKILETRLRQQGAVAHLGHRALTESDFDDLLREATELLAHNLDVDYTAVFQLLPGNEELHMRSGWGLPAGLVGELIMKVDRASPSGLAVLSRQSVIFEDLEREAPLSNSPLLRKLNVHSSMSVLISGSAPGEPFGVLGAYSQQPRSFTQNDLYFLQAVANVLSAAFEHQRIAAERDARLQAEQTIRKMETSARQRSILLETANRVALEVLTSRTGVEALRHIAESARALVGARYAALAVVDSQGEKIDPFISVGLTAEEADAIGPYPRGHGMLGLLLHREEPVRLDDLTKHPAAVGFPPGHPVMKSFLGIPILLGNKHLGSLYLTDKQGGGAFTEEDEVAIAALGSHAAVAIKNMQMMTRERALVQGLLMAQEDERYTLARDLHDGLTQYVMAAHAHLQSSETAFRYGNGEKAARDFIQGQKYLRQAVLESRQLVNGLRALTLDDLGLVGAISQLLDEEKARAEWEEVEFAQSVGSHRYEHVLETAVYRIAQESLTNARKYAKATRVRVALQEEHDATSEAPRLRLEIRDWGVGFIPEKVSSTRFGLHSISERASLLNANFALVSAPGEGTTITVLFPTTSPRRSPHQDPATVHLDHALKEDL